MTVAQGASRKILTTSVDFHPEVTRVSIEN